MNLEIEAVTEITTIEFEPHYLRRLKGQPRGKAKQLAGFTMVIEAEYNISLSGVKIETISSSISSRLTADEFNQLRKLPNDR